MVYSRRTEMNEIQARYCELGSTRQWSEEEYLGQYSGLGGRLPMVTRIVAVFQSARVITFQPVGFE